MKKAIIYFFSGTGNTKIAASEIQEALDAKYYATTLVEIKLPLVALPDPNDFDVAGFGYPVHAFNPPQLFLKTIKTLPKVKKDMPAFIFKTAGEPFPLNNASSWSVMRVLRRKGFSILMDRHLLMPYNILFRYPDALAKQMVLHTRSMAKLIATDICLNKKTERIIYPWTWLAMLFFRIQWVGARINGPLFHVKKEKCIQCGLCLKSCPSNNIKFVDGYPKFSFDCSMCMGCVMNCPKDAIRPGIISPIRVNGVYPFAKLIQDDLLRDDFINEETSGYFKSFRNYYRSTYEEIEAMSKSESDDIDAYQCEPQFNSE